MRLLEYQAKELFREYGIPVPDGSVARTLDGAKDLAGRLGYPVVLKAQVPVGGRGKAGAIKKVDGPEDLEREFKRIRSMKLGNYGVEEILVEKTVDIAQELYLSIFLDRSDRSAALIASHMGGIDVEEIGEKRIVRFPVGRLGDDHVSAVASYLSSKVDGLSADEVSGLVRKLGDLYGGIEAELAEINPLALTRGGKLVALDAKVITDDNATFRHPELMKYERKSELERLAERHEFSFVPLDGDVVVVGNGAGLVLSTLDLVKMKGLKPACFLDLGGGAPPERVYAALEIVHEMPGIRLYFINIFGGITNCVAVAQGLLKAKDDGLIDKPMVIRLSGTGEDEAREMLNEKGIKTFTELEDALDALEVYRR